MPLTGNFDLYYLIVESVFGNLLAAFLGILLAIVIIGVITRMSMQTISYIGIIFAATYFSLWFGGVFTAIAFIASMGYLVWSVLKFAKESTG